MAGFVWGDGGAQLTPEQIASQRKIAQAMMLRGGDYSPIQHWTQGMARVAEALVGGMRERGLSAAEAENTETNRKLVEALLLQQGGGAPIAPATAGTNPVSAAPMGGLPAMPSTAGKIYANDELSPLDPPSGVDRDRAIRTVVAEAANQGPTGMNAVASVIRNRAVNGGYGGDTPSGVVTAPKQFEPWNDMSGRSRMAAIDPNSPQYQAAGTAVDQAYAGNDPTNGATNFYAPKAQVALGRPAPAWDNGKGVDIGGHRFFGGAAPAAALTTAPPVAPAAAPSAGLSPAIAAALTNPASNEGTQRIAAMILQQQQANNKVQTVDAGNKILVMDARGNVVRELQKGEPNKGPEFGVIGKDAFGNEQYGWRDPRDKSVSASASPAAAAQAPTITGPDGKPMAIPPGIDPKIIRDAASKRAAEEGMPASDEKVSKLRNEVQGLPSYKKLANSAPVYKSMLEQAGQNDRAADLNLIYGFATVMDPDSVVRGEEMTMVKAIATLPEQLRAEVTSQLAGAGRLEPAVREALMRQARSRIGAYQGGFDRDMGMYRGIAQRGRMNEEDVIPSFGTFDEYKPSAAKPIEIDGYKIKAK